MNSRSRWRSPAAGRSPTSARTSSCGQLPDRCDSASGLAKQGEETLGVLGGGALLVVVEEDVDGASLPPPGANARRPVLQCLVGIVALVAAGGAVTSDIDVAGGDGPRRGRLVMVGEAERYVVGAQQRQDRRLVPARVPELEHIAVAARKPGEKVG